jgi:polyphosphate glucokinase
VREACDTILRIFNPRRLYVGGGNARHFVPGELGDKVVLIDNVAGLLGGIRLWD